MKVLVIGGTSFVGRALAVELVKAGHDVAVFHRRPDHDLPKKVVNIAGDRNDVADVRRAFATDRFEVVYDFAYDLDRGTGPQHVEYAVRAASDRLHRYIFLSSAAAYGDGLNHHEGDALAPDEYRDPFVRNKAMTERFLFGYHQRHRFPVVTLRPPVVYGPGNPYYREAFFWDRLREDRPIVLPGDGRRLIQFVHVRDLVWCCLRVLDHPGVVGHAFNIANSRPVTQMDAVIAFAEVANRKPQFVRVPRERILRAGGHPMGPKLYFGYNLDVPPITQIVAKAQRVLHFKATDFREGLKETYRWYLRNWRNGHRDYHFEDALMSLAASAAS